MYDVIVALDWAKSNMAVARLDKEKEYPKVFQRFADIEFLKKYLKSIKRTKSITIEESTSTHWLFLELVDYVDEVIIVDPYRNKMMTDGPKNDLKDAINLALLTRNRKLLREVHHSLSANYEIRKLVSGYEDVVKASVRAQNHLEAMKIYSEGKKQEEPFVMEKKIKEIEFFDSIRDEYKKRFQEISKTHKEVKMLTEVEGIGIKGAVKIVGTVLEANRFQNNGKYLAYCGLVKYRKQSGKRDYGEKITRYSRILKSVYKVAALSAISNNNVFKEYYDFLVEKKGLYDYNARNTIARMIAKITLTMLKSKTRYNSEIIKQKIEKEKVLLTK
jgi:transposase